MAVVAVLLVAAAPPAFARPIYVSNSGSDDVSVIDSGTNQPVGAPIATDSGPVTLAITPDGRRAYVVNKDADDVSVIDTATNQVLGAPIPVGTMPGGVAVSPDGGRAYVVNGGSNDVSVIDIATNQVIATIPVGANPAFAAISPVGSRAYVVNSGDADVSVIDTATDQVVGAPIPIGGFPIGIAMTPDGRRAYVANGGNTNVSVIDTGTNQVVATIPIGSGSWGVAVSPDGRLAYATGLTASAFAIDTATSQVVGAPIPVGADPRGVAFMPDGRRAYVVTHAGDAVSALDTSTGQAVATIAVGSFPYVAAIVPDQPPRASFEVPTARVGVRVGLNASQSTDPDGQIASYAWRFGDGEAATGPGSQITHVYPHRGRFPVTLTLTDNEGCSTALVFSGETAYCNGSGVATTERTVTVGYPRLPLRCPKRARRVCRVRAVAVSARRHGKVVSRRVRARLKPGRTKLARIRFKSKFLARQGAKRVLTRQVLRVGPHARVRYVRVPLRDP